MGPTAINVAKDLSQGITDAADTAEEASIDVAQTAQTATTGITPF